MPISVKCFASLRERLNVDKMSVPYESEMTVQDVWQQMTNQSPPDNLLCARNHEYVNFAETVRDGDEIAFFPPVTGG
ncbi:MAG: molybdopterin synthase sulfur carrier subunit [Gammaproteobacteria bacterium]|nr:molybdopterin synthase sulfur carrier subunit [Gammaproteobacteria bacterium]